MRIFTITVRDICFIGLFTAIIAVCAQLSIPMPYGVPLTLQTLAVMLAGMILGAKNGAISALVYALLGSAGAPVFAGFRGGISVLLGPTGGFLFSFPLLALAAGIGTAKSHKLWLAFWLMGGAAANYLCGALFFSHVTACGFTAAFAASAAPFIPAEILKMALAFLFGGRLKAALAKRGAV